ncbi:sodium:proton antiporter [Halostella sp. JP-L12]|uniref:cation:proton antiporter n=1 Tax=Halostella TaxID=1843185 RepID=UPI000EF84B4E|nr:MULTISPECIES: cation:proton antiporter [Halostella]NHN49777.1 sodium:proton antiporter [Halostella sp. JP-L12]
MVDQYHVTLVIISVAIFGAVVLPKLLSDKPMSFPLLYIAFGAVAFSLPIGMPTIDPVGSAELTERLTELVVIIALMGAGLKLDRPFDWRAWMSAWRLLGITMVITIFVTAVIGWWFLGMLPALAILFGAVIAPTDPVLAADVQVGEPQADQDEEIDPERQEGQIRFALTSEAGLNDGLAFPFTYAAILAAAGPGVLAVDWLGEWLAFYVVYKIVVGVIMGYVIGKVVAWLVFGAPSTTTLARVMEGSEALAATLLSYGLTEIVEGYGFIAVFVTALVLRHYEWTHDYHETLHDFAVVVERLLMAAVLILFGGALVSGLLAPLSMAGAIVAVVLVLVVRPVAGLIGMLGSSADWSERAVISFFGIRGIGSFYYLAYALNSARFGAHEEIWAIVAAIVLFSAVLHGVLANPVMAKVDAVRETRRPSPAD